MLSRHERKAAALEAIANALLELAAVEREPVAAAAEHGVPPRGPRTGDRPLPAGMTAWVSAEDVVHAVGCSRSKANEYLRAAAGRTVGTGQLLRVPVDVWEAWARDMLIDRLQHGRRETRRTSRRASSHPNGKTAVPVAPHQSRRRDLGPVSRVESKLPLITLLVPAKL